MKRLIALLLGIVLLLTAVPALADEETDDLNEIARKVEEEYLLPLSEGSREQQRARFSAGSV